MKLARVCFLESGFSEVDCAAIAYVTARRAERAGTPFAEMLTAYSAIDSGTARADEIAMYPDADVTGKPASFNRRWAALRAYAERIVNGEIADPCGATHWGSRVLSNDVARAERAVREGRWVPARCSKTKNAFYAEVRR